MKVAFSSAGVKLGISVTSLNGMKFSLSSLCTECCEAVYETRELMPGNARYGTSAKEERRVNMPSEFMSARSCSLRTGRNTGSGSRASR